jgi:pyruvate formate lyase activating enzyme
MEKGLVFNIQRYSIHDGPGIRTTVFLKSCPLSCFWCQNPESQAGKPEILLDKRKCTLCGACVAACGSKASWLLAESSTIDRRICVGCGECVTVCLNEARRLVGKTMTVEEVMHQVLRDVKFYENSGGGVTLSGGEAAAQPEFALSILKNCKAAGLHTVLDTCGAVSWSILQKLLDYTDLVLYDIKHMDEKKHREATGMDNRLILKNATRIFHHRPMRVRVPMIPGFNDSADEVRAIARFVKNELNGVPIDLLSYNRMGENKFEFLERECCPLLSQDENTIQALEAIVMAETGVSQQNDRKKQG